MKIIVLSDTHGRADRVREALSRHVSYDALLFSGDGLRDMADIAGCIAVKGNCDSFFFSDSVPSEQVLAFDGVRILLTHGHEYFVKSGLERLVARADELGADLAVFGHTHEMCEKYIPEGTQIGGVRVKKPMYLFNAGSLASAEGSFGVIEIRNAQILLSHGML